MNFPLVSTMQWTTADLDLLPEDDRRYEIINGELIVTRAPHWQHQNLCGRFYAALDQWCYETGLGEAAIAPGLVFEDGNNVIPDIAWASNERLADSLDEAGHLIAAPELIIEILSPGEQNEKRDRDLKLRLYSARGVCEYWIVNRHPKQIEVYRRENGILTRSLTFVPGDQITTPLLPGFAYSVDRLFH